MSTRANKKRPAAEAAERVRKTITLPRDQAKHLAAFAGFHERTESDVISEALIPVLKGSYFATRSSGRPGEPPSEGPPPSPPAE